MTIHNKYNNKKEYRKDALITRYNSEFNTISKSIIENIYSSAMYKKSKNILSFYPIDNEIDLRKLHFDTTKNWFLPRCSMKTKELFIHSYNYQDILIKNKWNILEPQEHLEEINPKIIDLIIIPALLIDMNGYRIGYGAGFYDRFIPKLKKNCIKLVPIAEIFIKEKLPYDNWDLPVDYIVSEKRIIETT